MKKYEPFGIMASMTAEVERFGLIRGVIGNVQRALELLEVKDKSSKKELVRDLFDALKASEDNLPRLTELFQDDIRSERLASLLESIGWVKPRTDEIPVGEVFLFVDVSSDIIGEPVNGSRVCTIDLVKSYVESDNNTRLNYVPIVQISKNTSDTLTFKPSKLTYMNKPDGAVHYMNDSVFRHLFFINPKQKIK